MYLSGFLFCFYGFSLEMRGALVVFNFSGVFGVSPAQVGKYDDPTDRNINQTADEISVESANQYPKYGTNDPEDYKYSAKPGISFHAVFLEPIRTGLYLASFTHKDGQSQTKFKRD